MNANELAEIQAFKTEELTMWERNHTATMLRQQQAEIEELKKTCLDEITKRVYADQTTKVMEGYWEEAQAEIEALKADGRVLIRHIADMNEDKKKLRLQKSYIVELEQALESSINLNKAQAERHGKAQ